MGARRRFGSVRQLASGRYQVRYRDSVGRTHRAPHTFETRRDAERWLSVTETDLLRNVWVDPRRGRITFAEWADDYLEHATYKRATTLATNRSGVERHLKPHLGEMPLVAITPLDVRRLLERLHREGLAPNTVRTVAGLLRTILNAAIDAELLINNPCRKMKLPPKKRANVRIVEPAQLDQLAEVIGEDYAPIVYLAGVLGMRWSEIAGLRVGNLDLLRRRLQITETLADVGGRAATKTLSSRRILSMPEFLVDLLAAHLARHRLDATTPDALVFTAPRGGRLWAANFHRSPWTLAVQNAGLPGLTFHALRHSSVALAIEHGAHARQIQERLGHSSITTTMDIYGHVLASSDEALTLRLNEQFSTNAAQSTAYTTPRRRTTGNTVVR